MTDRVFLSMCKTSQCYFSLLLSLYTDQGNKVAKIAAYFSRKRPIRRCYQHCLSTQRCLWINWGCCKKADSDSACLGLGLWWHSSADTCSATESQTKLLPELADKNHLEAGWKYRFLGPTPAPLNENLRRSTETAVNGPVLLLVLEFTVFFKKHLFIYLAVSLLSYSMRALHCILQDLSLQQMDSLDVMWGLQ